MRSNGILCPVSALPSKYGIGDIGVASYKFIDTINKCGIKYWQILPLNYVDSCNSPYASSCDSAFDTLYVSIEALEKRGLIKVTKAPNFPSDKVDYKGVREFKEKCLAEAYKKQKDTGSAGFLKFLRENSWLEKYALFTILLKKNDNQLLYNWAKEDREAYYTNKEKLLKKYKDEVSFIYWCQYELYREFDLLKEYLKKNDIKLIGDLPFYVGENSSDFFGHLDNFIIDENDKPEKVAGVPPDYFSPNGQKWGNPCYDVEYMKENGYEFLINRINKALNKYDLLRLDHFRAYDTYFEIPADQETAINGEWKKGVGAPFFEILKKNGVLDRIIVEDLGDVFPSVFKLRDDFNLPGMNIVEFTFLGQYFKVCENQIIYTSSHDNDTIVGWYNSLPIGDKNLIDIKFKYEKIDKKKKINRKFIEYAYKSPCKLCVIPVQDYLGLGSEARINTPGTKDENWVFRLTELKSLEGLSSTIKELIKKYDR